MELILCENNLTLAVANETTIISTSFIPEFSFNETDVVCRASTANGLEFENSVILELTGKQRCVFILKTQIKDF